MIVSHQHKFIFVANPKVASQTIRHILRVSLAESDWEQCGLYEKRRFPIPHLSVLGHGHLTLTQLKPFLSDDQWNNYYKFMFVREPLDRFLSACFYMNKSLINQPNPEGDLLEMLGSAQTRSHIHFKPQREFVSIDGRIDADFIGRYENLLGDLEEVFKTIGLKQPVHLEHMNRSHRNREFSPSPILRQAVERVFMGDYQAFDYQSTHAFEPGDTCW